MRHLFAFLLVLALAGTAAACNPYVITCDGPTTTYGMNASAWTPPATLCGDSFLACHNVLFEVTLTATSTLTANIAFPGAHPATQMTLLADCLGNECIAATDVAGAMSWSNCLPPGTYYLVVSDPTCLFYTFDFSVTCAPCSDPVAAEALEWGSVKTLYR